MADCFGEVVKSIRPFSVRGAAIASMLPLPSCVQLLLPMFCFLVFSITLKLLDLPPGICEFLIFGCIGSRLLVIPLPRLILKLLSLIVKFFGFVIPTL